MKSPKTLVGVAAVALTLSAQATSFSEGFDNVATLAGAGWLQSNGGTPPTNPWFQGNDGIFGSQSGAATSYIGADYLSSFSGAISNWLISPVLTLDPGSVLSFYAKSADTPGYGDTVDVLFSAGSGSDLASFVSLGTIGTAGRTGTFPADWARFSYALPGAAMGRFAFRLGGTTDTADYVGIDTVSVVSVAAPVPEPTTGALMALGLVGLGLVGWRASRRIVGPEVSPTSSLSPSASV